jgi:PAS domain S-box-containing protein
MRPPVAHPTGQERTFGADELIVSKTDLKGHIRYANDVFLRVSASTEDQIVGQPHSVIRHPEMPRAVYKLLWDTIQDGREMFAYVLNLAFDGAHYWVLAHVTPSRGPDNAITGYHSNRRRPHRSAVELVTPLYARLRAEERRHAHSPQGLAASAALLTAHLAQAGQTYERFVWALTPEDART